jgi:hypothetical protein
MKLLALCVFVLLVSLVSISSANDVRFRMCGFYDVSWIGDTVVEEGYLDERAGGFDQEWAYTCGLYLFGRGGPRVDVEIMEYYPYPYSPAPSDKTYQELSSLLERLLKEKGYLAVDMREASIGGRPGAYCYAQLEEAIPEGSNIGLYPMLYQPADEKKSMICMISTMDWNEMSNILQTINVKRA